MILTAITLLIQLLPGILQGVGVISPSLSKLISDLGAAVPGIIASLSSGQPISSDVVTMLQGFQTELAVLKSDTGLSPSALADATTLDGAITDALTAYTAAGKVDDPSTLTTLPTNL
jgi:hypothetical protein